MAIRRNSYVAEQLSSVLPVVSVIRSFRPHVLFTSEANLTFQLFKWRRWIGVPFRLLFSNGGPCGPEFRRMDFIHQVAPFYTRLSLDQGDLKQRHITVPYGISTPSTMVPLDGTARKALRRRLSLPEELPIILSVGYVDRAHKRMDYLIREIAALPLPRPHVVILGHQDDASKSIAQEAYSLLGEGGFTIRTVPYAAVSDYYRIADLFVLCSLKEGFGRVYLEAAMHGLPVIAHQHPVMQYVLEGIGQMADLSTPGALSDLLFNHHPSQHDICLVRLRWDTVRKRFDWNSLKDQYVNMFHHSAETSLPWLPAQ